MTKVANIYIYIYTMYMYIYIYIYYIYIYMPKCCLIYSVNSSTLRKLIFPIQLMKSWRMQLCWGCLAPGGHLHTSIGLRMLVYVRIYMCIFGLKHSRCGSIITSLAGKHPVPESTMGCKRRSLCSCSETECSSLCDGGLLGLLLQSSTGGQLERLYNLHHREVQI